MLIQLTIENFLSFRDEVTFSMVGVSSDRQHADRLIEDAAGKGRSVLSIAAIYGANAAGKSNLIKALIFAKELILEGTRSNRSIPVNTFKLGDYSKKPSKFEFIFTHQDARYSYGFKLNREQIIEEWLHVVPPGKKKEVMYFERITSSDRKTTVYYGSLLTERLINLIPALFLLQEEEKVIFIDELDRRLHPLLSRLFVKTVIDCRGKNNQLVFTTQDTNLLNLELLRRDEIWFVEKDLQGSSSLHSLAEFKMRPDLKIEKGYLNGRFGAIPFFGNLENLGWRDSMMAT
jgi:AAA15 family ATPase/GTPase